MSEDNENLGINMTNENLDEEVEDSDEESTQIYKYTNKGKVHEFNLGLLTPQERKKFNKMSSKAKQRFIASVELQQMPSMFDEISLKSVVYPDPDSNIANVQAAAAKYNELVQLQEDPKFKQMTQGYLKFNEAQKYITKNCPHVSQGDIDLLLRLKPDITVHQFINYYKNIMNDKNLVELNNIQKQLKNPYSDDTLKQVLNKGEQISKNILQLIVEANIGQLQYIKDNMEQFSDHNREIKEPLHQVIADAIGMSPTVNYSNYSPKQHMRFHILFDVVSNLINDVWDRCKDLSKRLTNMGMEITPKDVYEEVYKNPEIYKALENYIQEKMMKKAMENIAKSIKIEDFKEKKEKDSKEEDSKEEKMIMPRENQSLNVDPIDTENEPEESEHMFSFDNSSTYPVLSSDVIDNMSDTTSQVPQILNYNYDPTKDTIEIKPLEQAKNDFWSVIYKRDKEIENECNKSGEKYLKPGYIIGIQPASGSFIHLFIRYKSNNKLKAYSYDKSKLYETIKAAVKSGEKLDLSIRAAEGHQSSKQTRVGEYLNQSIIDAMKKAIELGGSIFSRIKNTFKAPDEIRETKMKLSELSEKTIQNNKSLRELEKTIEELTNRVNELSKQVGKSYVDRKISKPSFLDDIVKPQSLKPVEKKEEKELPVHQGNPDSMEEMMKRKMEERRRDLEPDYSEDSEEEWGEGVKRLSKYDEGLGKTGGKIKIKSSDTRKPIPMSDFFKQYL